MLLNTLLLRGSTRGALLSAAFSLSLLVGMPHAHANPQETTSHCAAQLAKDNGFIGFALENDFFARASNSDEHYTNGIQFSYLTPAQATVAAPLESLTRLPMFGIDKKATCASHRYAIAFGQELFTPDDTDTTALTPDDRPYAAWLHLTFALQSVWKHEASGAALQDHWKLDVGIVGPSAMGEQIQNDYHELIGVAESQGWDNQLEDEIGINLTFERSIRSPAFKTPSLLGLETDFVPYGVVSVGNVQTHMGLGGIFRLGPDVPEDFGPPRIYPGIGGSDVFTPISQFDWYVFAGLEGRAVARNIFLDGNSFRDSHSVTKYPFVAEGRLGIVAVVAKTARISYTHIFRSKEFREQPEPDQFGSLTLSFAL